MHGFRFYKSYPAAETRCRSARMVAVSLTVAILLCVIAIVILFFFVLDLKASRDRAVSDRAKAIDHAMCQVLAQFHTTSPDLTRVRAQLHCPTIVP